MPLPEGTRRRCHGPQHARRVERLEPRRLLAATFIKDVSPVGPDGFIDQPTTAGANLFFVQDSAIQSDRLWKTDGTAAGTVMLKDPYPANTNNDIIGLTAFRDRLYFFTGDPQGQGVWASDGTAAGTAVLRRLPANTFAFQPFVLGDRLYFFVDGVTQPLRLWSSDGTAAGTASFWTAPADFNGIMNVAAGPDGLALFTVDRGTSSNRQQIWATDGTAAGTRLAAEGPPGTEVFQPHNLTFAGGRLFFQTDDPGALWVADPDGTDPARLTVNGAPVTASLELSRWGDRVLFKGLVGNRRSLFVSDGTPAGTIELSSDINFFGLSPASGDRAYFFASTPDASHRGLWVTDGTPAGTRRAIDVTGDLRFVHGGKAYFDRVTPLTGNELWESDGTPEGTRLVQDIRPGPQGSYADDFGTLGDKIILRVSGGSALSELWNFDPSIPTSAIAGNAFEDPSRDGARQGFESYATLTVYLDANNNGRRDAAEQSQTTFDTGDYEFAGLPAGRYVVRYEPFGPGTIVGTTVPAKGFHVVDLEPGRDVRGLNFGVNRGLTVIHGSVYEDANRNGQRDAGEGAPSAQLQQTLYVDLNNNAVNDAAEPTARTAADGTYGFIGGPIAAGGTLTIRRVPTSASRQTEPFGWGGRTVTVQAGNAVQAGPFGVVAAPGQWPRVNGAVWDDWDRSGSRTRIDTRRNNASVFADLNRDGAWDPDREPVAYTDANGNYSFVDLPPGGVTLRVRPEWNPAHPQSPLEPTDPPAGQGRVVDVPVAGGAAVTVPDIFVFDRAAVPAPPAAPSGLRVTSGQIFDGRWVTRLYWTDNATNELYSLIERRHETSSGGGGQWERVGETGPTNNGFFTDFGVSAGNRYTYRVVAVNPGGESPPSNEAQVLVVPFLGSPVKDIHPTAGSDPAEMTAFRGAVYFAATDPEGGRELWRSDGTEAGTVRLKDINAGAAGSNPEALTVVGGTLYFTAVDAAHGRELWKTDGTVEGTVLVKDLEPGTGSLAPADLLPVGDTLYFLATTAFLTQLWKSDGTSDGTVRVSPVPLAIAPGNLPDGYMAAMGGAVYFRGGTNPLAAELWKTDGTEAGTVLVKDIYPGPGSSVPHGMTVVGNTLYFFATDTQSRHTLYRTDGTEAGTVAVRRLYDGNGSSTPGNVTATDGALLFTAFDPALGNELWRSDGTQQGTAVLRDIAPGNVGSGPYSLLATPAGTYFVASPNQAFTAGPAIYRTDGTAAGTVPVVTGLPRERIRLAEAGGTVFFTAGGELFAVTPQGSKFVQPVLEEDRIPFTSDRGVLDGALFFSALMDREGRELWQVADKVPNAPSDAAASAGPAGITVTWNDRSTDEAGFLVERSRSADFATIDGVGWAPAGAESFSDTAYRADGQYYYRVRAYNAAGEGEPSAATGQVPAGPASTVAGRHVFYNNSAFDGGTPFEPAPADDDAIDPTKRALLPGERASADNITGAVAGLTGLMIDLAGLAGRVPRRSDFVLETGTGADPSAWQSAGVPAEVLVGLRRGAGVGGADRVTLLMPQGVRNAWLRVTVLPTATTGLAFPDVFYFGNLAGETGDTPTAGRVSALDLAAVKRERNRPAHVADRFDFDKNGRVDALDLAAARQGLGRSLSLFTATPLPPA